MHQNEPDAVVVPAPYGRRGLPLRLGNNPAHLSGTAARRIRNTMSAVFVALATVVGVRVGLGGPAVSPVSPAAIAQLQQGSTGLSTAAPPTPLEATAGEGASTLPVSPGEPHSVASAGVVPAVARPVGGVPGAASLGIPRPRATIEQSAPTPNAAQIPKTKVNPRSPNSGDRNHGR
jgi:hypothetical protein